MGPRLASHMSLPSDAVSSGGQGIAADGVARRILVAIVLAERARWLAEVAVRPPLAPGELTVVSACYGEGLSGPLASSRGADTASEPGDHGAGLGVAVATAWPADAAPARASDGGATVIVQPDADARVDAPAVVVRSRLAVPREEMDACALGARGAEPLHGRGLAWPCALLSVRRYAGRARGG